MLTHVPRERARAPESRRYGSPFQRYPLEWTSTAEWLAHLEHTGLTHNIVALAGHGSTRTSIRGFDPRPLSASERSEQRELLARSLDEGAAGVSLGLQYEPGVFATFDELADAARVAHERGKLLTVHARALSALSGTYPIVPFGRPHNLLAIDEMLEVVRRTGVRLQYSHLIFVGARSFSTVDEALSLFERARREGLDVMFDTYAHSCGASIINVVLPKWVLARMPEVLDDPWALARLRLEINAIRWLLGFGYEDIQISHANDPELAEYHGMFTDAIAEARGLSKFDNFVDLVRRSGGRARVLMHRYSTPAIVERLLAHPASLCMTDAWLEPDGLQNPAAFGTYPRMLAMVRERRLLTLEEAIRKMTFAGAERFGIRDRGRLAPGLAADVVVFDDRRAADRTTKENTSAAPEGIEHVFVNGAHALDRGAMVPGLRAGRVLRT